jgi:hypothetical protein
MSRPTTCPSCVRGDLEIVARLGDQPTVGTVLYTSRAAALAAPSAPVDVGYCSSCGLLRNVSFDPDLVPYDDSYENSQHFSPRFEAYVLGLARHLVESYDLGTRAVAEIGSGKGEFLVALCEAGVGRAYGIDPTYAGEIDDHPLAARVECVRRLYDAAEPLPDADLVCCRHTLEHLVEPAGLLLDLRRSLDERSTALYVEVPNGEFVLSPTGLWDVIYQHVSYFTAASLEALFGRCGFDIVDLRTEFDGQFLAVEARPTGTVSPGGTPQRSTEGLAERVRAFSETYDRSMARWQDTFCGRDADVVLWGAGAKGVTFLNTTAAGDGVRAVVDVNPRKQGGYVAGTGQPIIAPRELVDDPPTDVLVMNPAYLDEVRRELDALGLAPSLSSV